MARPRDRMCRRRIELRGAAAVPRSGGRGAGFKPLAALPAASGMCSELEPEREPRRSQPERELEPVPNENPSSSVSRPIPSTAPPREPCSRAGCPPWAASAFGLLGITSPKFVPLTEVYHETLKKRNNFSAPAKHACPHRQCGFSRPRARSVTGACPPRVRHEWSPYQAAPTRGPARPSARPRPAAHAALRPARTNRAFAVYNERTAER